MAERLGLSATEVRAAVERLIRLGLLTRRGGKLVSSGRCTTTQDVPSAALKRFHRQGLERAIDALEGVEIEDRDITSITMAVDHRKVPAAKAQIRKFRRQLAKSLESGERDEVYQLSIQLVPITRKKGGKKE
jgi:uncharacterized protein (TIGR02147 family)